MYKSAHFHSLDKETFSFDLPEDRKFRIMQLTDCHLGYGKLSESQDTKAEKAITTLIEREKPDLIIITGDLIYPVLPKSGTLSNDREMREFMQFMDGFKIPYASVLGNHDSEMGSKATREEIGDILETGEYSIFRKGPDSIFGVGNYTINLNRKGKTEFVLAMLDSNMYGDGWFYTGFDCIHRDQTDWCMEKIRKAGEKNRKLSAFMFFHMPLPEYKEAYEKMKMGDHSVKYNFGSVLEKNEYFGITNRECNVFDEALKTGFIKGMFCGHDHLNTISMEYKGICLTYGMSIDYLAYPNIESRYTQRGATVMDILPDGKTEMYLSPLGPVVSKKVRGKSRDIKRKGLL